MILNWDIELGDTRIGIPSQEVSGELIVNILVADVGGTNVKILVSGESEPRRFQSGKLMTAEQMVRGVKELAGDWKYDAVSVGYPGVIHRGRIVVEPHNLAPGWVDFNFPAAFGCPVKLLNDAAMQAHRGATRRCRHHDDDLGSRLCGGGAIA